MFVVHRAERERELLAMYRDFSATAPEQVGTAFVHFTGPADDELIAPELVGEPLVLLVGMYAGPVAEGEQALAALRAFGPPLADGSGPMPYADFQCSIDDPPGFRNYWTAAYVTDLGDAALDVIAEHSARTPSGPAQTFIVPWGGAVERAGGEGTPMAKRDAAWVVHPFGLWEDPADDEACMAWGRGFRDALAPYASGGVYLNFIGDEGEERVRAAFGDDAYVRLSAIKAKYDPENLFRGNHNITPAAAAARGAS